MDPATIIQLVALLLPVAEKAGVDLTATIQGIQQGKTTDTLIAEATAKRDDLPSLDFGQ